MRRSLLVPVLFLAVACGDDTSGVGGNGTTSSAQSTATSATTAIATVTANATTALASSSTGSDDPMPCVLAEAEDRTGGAPLTIAAAGVNYTPRCVRVSAGTEVTFEVDFVTHPLAGGTVVDGVPMVDPSSPIPTTDSGTSVTVTLDEVGEVPFFCDRHASIGMFGTIWVE